MKIGIISDSHENMPLIAKAVDIFNDENVDLVIHAGDIISPITSREFKKLKAKMIGVFGNNDGDKAFLKEKFKGIAELYDPPHEVEIDKKKFLVMHAPQGLEPLMKNGKYDVLIYGHTHEVELKAGRPMVINPGECGGWLTGRKSVAVLDTGKMVANIIDLNGR